MTDQNKNKEIVNSKPKQIKSLTQKPIPFERKPKQIEINPQLKQNSEMLKPNNFHQLDNKNDETAEVLRLFNSSHLRNSFNSKKEIHDPILPVNITNTSLFSHKAGKDKGTDYNSRTPFTKVKGISIQESLMKEQPNGPIFDYNKNN